MQQAEIRSTQLGRDDIKMVPLAAAHSSEAASRWQWYSIIDAHRSVQRPHLLPNSLICMPATFHISCSFHGVHSKTWIKKKNYPTFWNTSYITHTPAPQKKKWNFWNKGIGLSHFWYFVVFLFFCRSLVSALFCPHRLTRPRNIGPSQTVSFQVPAFMPAV